MRLFRLVVRIAALTACPLAAQNAGAPERKRRSILMESDSLFLTNSQIGALVHGDSPFQSRVRDLYRPLAEFLFAQPSGAAGTAALDSANATDKLYWVAFWDQTDTVNTIIVQQQRDLMPMLKNIANASKESRKTSRMYFGFPLPAVYKRPRIGSN